MPVICCICCIYPKYLGITIGSGISTEGGAKMGQNLLEWKKEWNESGVWGWTDVAGNDVVAGGGGCTGGVFRSHPERSDVLGQSECLGMACDLCAVKSSCYPFSQLLHLLAILMNIEQPVLIKLDQPLNTRPTISPNFKQKCLHLFSPIYTAQSITKLYSSPNPCAIHFPNPLKYLC